MTTRSRLLEVNDVTVRFGGTVALDDVSVAVDEHTITGLIGPNGAGKTTTFNVIAGTIQPAAGSVLFDGVPLDAESVLTRSRRGIARTFQNLQLSTEQSVLENVIVGMGRFLRHGLVQSMLATPQIRRMDADVIDRAAGILRMVGLSRLADVPAGSLPYGLQRRLEIGRALALNPRLVLLDEPTAGMGPQETGEIAVLLSRLRDDYGVTILVVEHDTSFIRNIADFVYVLDFGRLIAAGDADDVLANPVVVDAYLGSLAEEEVPDDPVDGVGSGALAATVSGSSRA